LTRWIAHEDDVLNEEAWADWDGWFVAEARRRPRMGWTGNRKNHGDELVCQVGRVSKGG